MRSDDPAPSNPADGRRPAWTSRLTLTVGAFVCGLLVALLAVLFFGKTLPGGASASGDPAQMATPVATGNRQGFAVPRSVGSPASAISDGSDSAEMEICGMPGLTLDPAIGIEDDPRFAARIDATNKRFIDALSSNADERVRAAGLLLRRQEDLRLASRAEAASIDGLCGTDVACVKAAERQATSAATMQSVGPATDALARLAATSTDPAVYAAAIDACTSWARPSAPGCQLVSVGQWARIDPDNVDAWLHVAGAAANRKDADALDDAMNHVAHAKAGRIYGDTLAALVDAAVPAGDDAFDVSQMRLAAWRLFSGWTLPPLQTATGYCAQPLLADSNRRQTCDAVAHQLIDNGSTMIDRGVGIRLGSRLGWPGETVTALRQEQNAMQRAELLGLRGNGYGDVSSCSAVAAWHKLLLQAGQLGEVAYARSALAASGRSVADLAAEVETERASAINSDRPAGAASQPPSN